MKTKHEFKIPEAVLNSKLGKKLGSGNGAGQKAFVPIVILLLILLIVGGFFLLRAMLGLDGVTTYSGTIEATEYHLGSETGGRVDAVEVKEGEQIRAGQTVAVVRGERVRSTVSGVVIERLVERGEIASMGGTIVVVADLDNLTLVVYVPEDRYGKISLGQNCQVKVDSYPGEVFTGKVSHIADKAEFTPRNVQTVDSRKNTVFAIKLDLNPSGGKLKPGMPADVIFQFDN